MAHFAQIDEQGTVTQVIVVNNEDILDENGQESEAVGRQFCQNLIGGEWVQTSYNNNFRKQYAPVGGRYDRANDVFITAQPFSSWSLDANFEWQAPAPMPEPCDDCVESVLHDDCDCGNHFWDEQNQQWIKQLMSVDLHPNAG